MDVVQDVEYTVDNKLATLIFIVITWFAFEIDRGILNALLCGVCGTFLSIILGHVLPSFFFGIFSQDFLSEYIELTIGIVMKILVALGFCILIGYNQSFIKWNNHKYKEDIASLTSEEKIQREGFFRILTNKNGTLWIGNANKKNRDRYKRKCCDTRFCMD